MPTDKGNGERTIHLKTFCCGTLRSMKRLFGLLFVFVALFSFPGKISEVAAQGSQVVSKSTLQTKADTLFSNFVSQLEAKQANPKSIPSLANATDTVITKYVEGNKALVIVVKEGQARFSSLFENPATNSSNIYADFTAALNSAKDRISAGANQTTAIRTGPTLLSEVQQIAYQINNLSQERQDELRNTGKVDEAIKIQSDVSTLRAAEKDDTPEECFNLTHFSIGACISEFVTWTIKSVFVEIAGFVLWLTSNMFSHVMRIGVLEFKSWAPDTLYPIWVLVRQIVSLGVVFVGLYLGFMYILGREDTFAKYIPWVMVFALFVNFSYPLARFGVDLSNIITLNIYTASVGNEALVAGSDSAGAVIMHELGLNSLVMAATEVEGRAGVDLLEKVTTIPGALLTVVFVFYAAYVFFMATAILAVRTAALVFLTVASPFLFIDSVLPLLGDKAQQIRKIFFEQLAVAPVFTTLLAITLKFITIFSEDGPLSNSGSITEGGKDVTVFFNIFMMLIMLHLTIKITKSVSGTIGQYASDAMGKVGGFAAGGAAGMAMGGAGILARNSIGRLATKARDSKWVTNNQDNFFARRAYDMSNSFAKKSYDLRNSSVVAGGMNKLGMRSTGKGRTAGYEEAMEKRRTEILARGERMKTFHEKDVYEDEKDEKGNKVYETYDVTDKDGNFVRQEKKAKQKLVHRKGDVDEEGDKAFSRYVAKGGGSVFMSEKQRSLAREALGEKAEEVSKKRIEEAKQKSLQDIATYEAIKDDPFNSNRLGRTEEERGPRMITAEESKKNFRAMLKEELEGLKKEDPNLKGQQAQSLIQTLQKIDEKRSSETVEKYSKTKESSEKERVLHDVKSELTAIRARDGNLESTEARALLRTLRSIEELNQKAAKDIEEKADRFVKKYEGLKGTAEEIRIKQNKMIENELEDNDELRAAISRKGVPVSNVDGKPKSQILDQHGDLLDTPTSKQRADVDLDLTYNEWSSRDVPPVVRGTKTPNRSTEDITSTRERDYAPGAERVRAELENNQRQRPSPRPPVVDIPTDIPGSHDPTSDDAAAIAAAYIEKWRNGPPPTGTTSTSPVRPRPPTSPSPASSSVPASTQTIIDNLRSEVDTLRKAVDPNLTNRLNVIEGFLEATGGQSTVRNQGLYNEVKNEASKMGFDDQKIEELFRDATSGSYTKESLTETRKNSEAVKRRLSEAEKKLKDTQSQAEMA